MDRIRHLEELEQSKKRALKKAKKFKKIAKDYQREIDKINGEFSPLLNLHNIKK